MSKGATAIPLMPLNVNTYANSVIENEVHGSVNERIFAIQFQKVYVLRCAEKSRSLKKSRSLEKSLNNVCADIRTKNKKTSKIQEPRAKVKFEITDGIQTHGINDGKNRIIYT